MVRGDRKIIQNIFLFRYSICRHTIVPVQLALCFSLVVQGNNESQRIFPTVKEQFSDS